MASQLELFKSSSVEETNTKNLSIVDKGFSLFSSNTQHSHGSLLSFLTQASFIGGEACPFIGRRPIVIDPGRANNDNSLSGDTKQIVTNDKDCSNRTLIIVPGYSVSNPPRVGDHRYYIKSLKYDPKINPRGYKRIFIFDLYSKKDGRCNFKASISELADELWRSINSLRDNWHFQKNGEVDFIGASMGGLIVRKFTQKYCTESNYLATSLWGKLRVRTILLIGTPNHGCKLVDKLQSPLLQFLLRILQGKDNFSTSKQVQQISVGNVSLPSRLFRPFRQKKSPKNMFLQELNTHKLQSENIRWITLRGTKSNWYGKLIYGFRAPNDGVIEANRAMLEGAENICDKDLSPDLSWDHRDLYQDDSVCILMKELLINNRTLNDCRRIYQLTNPQAIPQTAKNTALFRTHKQSGTEN
jgi:pimeloyl-ACP methyl ester carboxylesterase